MPSREEQRPGSGDDGAEPGQPTASGTPPILPELAEPDDALANGDLAGDYVVERVLGEGGAGRVYLATRVGDGKRAAVKVLRRSTAATKQGAERFLREVATVHRIKHPNIIDIYDVGRLPDGRPYYAMELLDGANLRSKLEAAGRFSPAESLAYLEPVCAGLAAAHAAGVVHRDLKLDNVMVDDVDDKVTLVDFGIAKLLEPDPDQPALTTTGQFLGTPAAMAPEQILGGAIDRRTDIYALGILAYNLLTGTSPFRGNWEDVTTGHLAMKPRPPSALVSLPPAVDAVVLRCLEKDPAARFATVDAFVQAYRAAALGEEAPTRARVGIGVLVRASALDEADVDALTEATLALDTAEAELRGDGMQIALLTSTEVLAVLASPSTAAEELELRRRVIASAHRLHDLLRAALPAGVRISVSVRSDEIQVRDDGGEVVGGALLELDAWGPALPGVSLTMMAPPRG